MFWSSLEGPWNNSRVTFRKVTSRRALPSCLWCVCIVTHAQLVPCTTYVWVQLVHVVHGALQHHTQERHAPFQSKKGRRARLQRIRHATLQLQPPCKNTRRQLEIFFVQHQIAHYCSYWPIVVGSITVDAAASLGPAFLLESFHVQECLPGVVLSTPSFLVCTAPAPCWYTAAVASLGGARRA